MKIKNPFESNRCLLTWVWAFHKCFVSIIFYRLAAYSSHTVYCTDYGCPMKHFSLKSRTFGLRQTNWADKFWGIWGYFQPNYQHPFRYSESLVHVFHYSTIISTKSLDFISTSQIFFWDWDMNLGRKEKGFSLRVSVVRGLLQ